MRRLPSLLATAASALIVSLAAGCASQPGANSAASTPATSTSTLNRLIEQAGLAQTLQSTPHTVFAPSDEAFRNLPAGTLDALSKDPARLKAVLSYHVIPVKVSAGEVRPGKVKTLQGAELSLARAGTFVTVEDALVVSADQNTSQGVVHVIDRVLMPPR